VTATAVETIFAGAPKVPTIEIAPNPKNPRGKIERADIEELAASVRANGILVPLILRKGDKGYVVVAGHRRLAAAKLVGLSEVPAVIVPQDKGRDLELALIENEQRQDLDPLATAAAVADLLERKGATVDGVAATLGKSRRWVALRASLSKLSPKVLKARTTGELREWPAEWLLELGVLSAQEQDALVSTDRWSLERVGSRADVVRLVEHRLCRLKEAPWDLADAKLVAKQGACTTCTRHSAAAPGLFEAPAAAKIETALCRDSGCFTEKRNAWRSALVRTKRTELGEKLVLAHSANNPGYTHHESEALKKSVGQPIVSSYDLQRAKKGEAGAVPVLTIDGPDEGTVRWAKKGKAAASSNGRAPGPAKPSSLKDLREALDKRRRKAAVLEARALLEKLPVTAVRSDEQLLSLVAAFGVEAIEADENPEKGQSEAWPALHLAAIPRRAAVWEGVRERILHDHLRDWMTGNPDAALTLADLEDYLGIPWKRLLAEQTAKIPEPKSWGERKPAAVKKPARATMAERRQGRSAAKVARTSKARS
jgi:ParB/RepB/Spo0J family partition protein